MRIKYLAIREGRMLEKAKGRLCYDGQKINLCANSRAGLAIMEECVSFDVLIVNYF